MIYFLGKGVICHHLSLLNKVTKTGESGKTQIWSHLPEVERKVEGIFSYRIQVCEVHAPHCMCSAPVHQSQETNPCDRMGKS